MKIVMTYEVSDGCTYSNIVHDCLEHDSVEQAFSDFVDKCRERRKKYAEYWNNLQKLPIAERLDINRERITDAFEFCGREYNASSFIKTNDGEVYEDFPEFDELDNWFKKNLGI
jgi:hypothetical protein